MKNIINNLIRVANNLDSLGYMEEANIVDRVAKKIIVSANPEIKRLEKGEASSIVVSGDYATDILKYKRLYYSGYYDARGDYNEKGYNNYLRLAKEFLLDVRQKYSSNQQQLKAFEAQAARIREDISQGVYHIEANVDIVDKDKPLNFYLKKYDLVDDNGSRKYDISDMQTFNTRWNNLLREPDFKNYKYPIYLRKQLDRTKQILQQSIKV